MITETQNQAQIEKKLKKEITPSEWRILELLLSLSIRHPVCYLSNKSIAKRLNLSVSTVKRFFRKIAPLFFWREYRFKNHRQQSSLTHFLPEWMHLDNLRWLVKKFFPSLYKFPVFRPKFAAKLLASAMSLLQVEMNPLSSPPIYINNLVTCKSPIKSERKNMVMRADKPDYVKTWQKKEESPTVDRRKLFPAWKAPVRPVEDLQESEKKNFARVNDPNDSAAANISSFLQFVGPALAAELKSHMFPIRCGKNHEENQKI